VGKLEDQLKELDKVRRRGLLTDDEYASKRAAIIHDPTNLSVRKGRDGGGGGGGLFKWGVLGCLGIFAAIGVFVVCVIVVVAVALSNISSDTKDVTVRIDGTPGVLFSGSIGNAGSQRTVDGTTPQSFTITGKKSSGIFTAVIQKKGADGMLRVTVTCPKGGDQTQETSAQFGIATVSCSPF